MSAAIEPILRTLGILQAMNRRQLSTLKELSLETRLPKSTIHRLLATLIHAGFVRKDESAGVYSLTSKVLTLADGFHANSWLVEVAAPVAEDITRRVKWPVAVSVYDMGAMVVCYSTRNHSSLTLQKTTINQRFPMIKSAMGQAYLGFCGTAQRKQIISMLRSLEADKNALIHNNYQLHGLLTKVRRDGHGTRIGSLGESTHIAVPVMHNQDVGGVIGISLFSSCYNEQSRLEYLAMLKLAAKKIEHVLVNITAQAHAGAGATHGAR